MQHKSVVAARRNRDVIRKLKRYVSEQESVAVSASVSDYST